MRKAAKSEILWLIDEYIVGRNATRNKEIIRDRFIDGMTYDELASKYHLSVNQLKNIVKRFRRLLDESTPK